MSSRAIVGLAALLICGAWGAELRAAGPRVEIEIFQVGRVSPTVPQEWMRILSEVGFSSPRIRSARGGDKIGVTASGSGRSLKYRVTGQLGTDGRIQITARDAFRQGDRERLRSWLKELKEHGPGGEPVKGEFGLTAEQFAAVTKDLAVTVKKSTKGETADVVKQLEAGLRYPLRFDRGAKAALQKAGAVKDELQGFATGTALAAVLRPAGLVFRPQFAAGRYEYLVTAGRRGVEMWPVGRSFKGGEADVMPKLVSFQATQQVRLPLSVAMDEMSRMLEVAVLFDHRGLARKKIDVTTTEVEMQQERRIMKRILLRILGQAGLRYDVRVDDAGRAFLWVRPKK